ncbi:PAS domain S-box protein [Candidatus Poribacteria bacterium]|nr:PAS domain S-box protein [Candidatus Poribacteria bacterium]
MKEHMKTIRVLLVEDDEDDALILEEMLAELKDIHFDIKHVSRLEEGFDCLSDSLFDVILLDLNLPDSFGIETLKKTILKANDIPIVVLTGLDDKVMGINALHEGAQDYLVKSSISSGHLAKSMLGHIDRGGRENLIGAELLERAIRYAIERQSNTLALQLSENRFRRIIEHNVDAIIVVDRDGIVKFVNPAAERLFGRGKEEIQQNIFEFAIGNESTEIDIAQKSGKIITVEVHVTDIDWEGEPAYLASLRDITERKRAADAIRRRAVLDRMRASIYEMEDNISITNILNCFYNALNELELDFEDCSIQLVDTENHGFSISWRSFYEGNYVFHQMDSERVNLNPEVPFEKSAVFDSWKSKKPIYRRDLHKDDSYKELEILKESYEKEIRSVLDVPFAYGTIAINHAKPNAFSEEYIEILQMLSAVISEGYKRYFDSARRKQAEQALKDSEEKLRLFMDSAADSFTLWDSELNLIDLNNASMKYFPEARSKDEVIGISIKGFRPCFEEDICKKFFEVIRTGKTFTTETEVNCPDIGYLFLEIRVFKVGNGLGMICMDVTERKEMEKMKSEFVSIVSHELRSPLTAIMNSLTLLSTGDVGELPNIAKRMVEIAHRNSQRLLRLINDMLDIKKIEAGRMEFRMQPVDLKLVIQQSIESNSAYAEELEVGLKVENDIPDVKVNVDVDRLIQVLTNLITNAIKYSKSNSSVTITASNHNGFVRVDVIDSGPGIPIEFRDKVFEKFSQAKLSGARKKDGSGLGLSIAKAITEAMKGEIGFETKINVGTDFYFKLPIYRSEDTPVDTSPQSYEIIPSRER